MWANNGRFDMLLDMKSPYLEEARKFKALIFDCDGTLADTMPYHYESWHMAMKNWGHTVSDQELLDYRGMSSFSIVADLNSRYGWNIDPQAFSDRKEEAFYECALEIKEILTVTSLVHEFHSQKPMAVISGGILTNVMHALSAIKLEKSFNLIIGADNEWGLAPKPSPEAFLFAANKLGVQPAECLVFEDGDTGIVAAQKAGMSFIDVRIPV